MNSGECEELNMQPVLSPLCSLTYFRKTSSESSGHKRSSSWGRTYSFTSAVSRGCVTEEENQNVKAGAQAMLQVCGLPQMGGGCAPEGVSLNIVFIGGNVI